MIRPAAALALLMAALPLSAESRQEFTKEFSRTLPLAAPQKLRIENSNGDVRVKTHPGGDATIRASIRVSSSDREGAEKFAADVRIEVESGADGISVRTVFPEKSWSFHGAGYVSYSVDYDVTMPDTAPLEVRNRFGNVSVAGLHAAGEIRNSNGSLDFRSGRGVQRLENSFGSLTVVGNAGDLSVTNANGSTTISDVDGRLEVENRFGKVEASKIRRLARIVNSNGDVSLRDAAGGCSITASFGRIEADGITGDAELRNSNGAITVRRVQGSARIQTSFGPVDASGIGGSAAVDDSNGAITLDDVHGAAEIRGSFGAIRATHLAAASVTASNAGVALSDVAASARVRTSFGPVGIDRVGGAVDVENQNGSIEVRASAGKSCSGASLRTSFGGIRFVLPANPDYRVDARTTFGRIHSDVPIEGAGPRAGMTDSSLSGTIGAGRCPLVLTDSNGSIDIVR